MCAITTKKEMHANTKTHARTRTRTQTHVHQQQHTSNEMARLRKERGGANQLGKQRAVGDSPVDILRANVNDKRMVGVAVVIQGVLALLAPTCE